MAVIVFRSAAVGGLASDVLSANIWLLSLIFGLTAVVILMLCAKKKKRNSVTMIRYVQNEELEVIGRSSSRTVMKNGNGMFEKEKGHRISQYSSTKENRHLPDIPQNTKDRLSNRTPSPQPVAVASATSTLSDSALRMKESRRLPALPPVGQDNMQQSGNTELEKGFETTYEDVPDENDPAGLPSDAFGNGHSPLRSKVSEDLQKRDDDDMYARVGGDDTTQKLETTGVQQNAGRVKTGSSSSEEDANMSSPTAVTYASIDKMKKTMSVKRNRQNSSSSKPIDAPPPVPDRNFDEEDGESGSEDCPPLPPPFVDDEAVSGDMDRGDSNGNEEHAAYATVSVRESFAHQRLRQMVEEEQLNRYVNTSTGQQDLSAQNGEEASDSLYENISTAGSGDGFDRIASHNLRGTGNTDENDSRFLQEDGYATIGTDLTLPPPPPELLTPEYDNIEPVTG